MYSVLDDVIKYYKNDLFDDTVNNSIVSITVQFTNLIKYGFLNCQLFVFVEQFDFPLREIEIRIHSRLKTEVRRYINLLVHVVVSTE